VFFFLLQFSL